MRTRAIFGLGEFFLLAAPYLIVPKRIISSSIVRACPEAKKVRQNDGRSMAMPPGAKRNDSDEI